MDNVIASLFANKVFYDQIFKTQVKHDIKHFKANEKIIKQGTKYPFFCFIKSGTARVVLNEKSLERNPIHTVIASLGPNDIFGEFGLFVDYPASADVIAITDSEIILADIESFRHFLQQDTQTGYKILFEMLQQIIKRLTQSNATILHLMKSAIEFQKQLQELIKQP